MLTNVILLEALWILASYAINDVKAVEALADYAKRTKDRYTLDLSGCSVLEKQCSHLDDDLALLSCSINTSHNNKTQVPFSCQHKIWTHQAELLDNSFLNYKLSEPCQDEVSLLECLKPGENGIDCLLKKKNSVRNKICWRMVNKIESLIFNDWQIIKNYLRNCLDDIQAYTCGRIPPDPKSLSQTHAIKCLLNKEQMLRPECQSEITALNEMKYSTLQLDKIIFAACNLDQKNFCPDEVSGTWLMYKCLVRHKYENGKYGYSDYYFTILSFILDN